MPKKISPVERATRNFIRNYGKHALRELIMDFEHGRPHSEAGKRLGVTRERVRQWQKLFGTLTRGYMIHPDIEVIAKKRKDRLGEKPEKEETSCLEK